MYRELCNQYINISATPLNSERANGSELAISRRISPRLIDLRDSQNPPYAAIRVSGLLSSSTAQTQADLKKRGVSYSDGKLSLKTDRAPPSRDDYIASTQRAFERGAKNIAEHADAFRTGSGSPGVEQKNPITGSSSAVQTPEKKGFQRGKKLA